MQRSMKDEKDFPSGPLSPDDDLPLQQELPDEYRADIPSADIPSADTSSDDTASLRRSNTAVNYDMNGLKVLDALERQSDELDEENKKRLSQYYEDRKRLSPYKKTRFSQYYYDKTLI